ncbi:MAG: CopD family protein [Nitrospiria bacterium]
MLSIIVSWLHLVAAMFWIGGSLFFVAVVVPSLKEKRFEAVRNELIRRIGKRFRCAGWFSLALLLISGTLRLYLNGVSLSRYGGTLWIKLGLVFVVIGLTVYHDWAMGPKGSALRGRKAALDVLYVRARWAARLNLLTGLLIVLFAVVLSPVF